MTPPREHSALLGRQAQRRSLLRAAGLLAACALPVPQAGAQQHGEVTELLVEDTDSGVLLSAAWRMDLPPSVENALYQGIAMHFIAEARVVQPRWYWRDRTVAHAVRYVRLSYQPLTRRWRLAQTSTDRGEGAGVAASLGQNFDELADALMALQRIARWKIAEASALQDGAHYLVSFQFRLDTSQLPRLLQFGTAGRPGWDISLTRRIELIASETAR